MTGAQLQGGASRPATDRARWEPDPVLRRLCATVLCFEAIVLVLAIPVAVTIEHLHPLVAGVAGGGLAAAAVLVAIVVGRYRWTVLAGSVLQALMVASGIVVPVMYALGVIFGGLWVTGFWLARRLRTVEPR